MFGLFRLANFPVHALSYGFQYIRSVLCVEQTAAPFLPKLVQATNLTHLGPLSDLSRLTAFHYCCASRSFNHHHFFRGTNYSATQWARCQCLSYPAGFSATVLQPSRLLCSCPSTTFLNPSLPQRPQLQHRSSDTRHCCASAPYKFDSRGFFFVLAPP